MSTGITWDPLDQWSQTISLNLPNPKLSVCATFNSSKCEIFYNPGDLEIRSRSNFWHAIKGPVIRHLRCKWKNWTLIRQIHKYGRNDLILGISFSIHLICPQVHYGTPQNYIPIHVKMRELVTLCKRACSCKFWGKKISLILLNNMQHHLADHWKNIIIYRPMAISTLAFLIKMCHKHTVPTNAFVCVECQGVKAN